MFVTQIKPLVLFTSAIMATLSISVVAATNTKTAPRKDVGNAKTASKEGVKSATTTATSGSIPAGFESTANPGTPVNMSKDDFVIAGRPKGMPDLVEPSSVRRSAGRFAESRSGRSATYFHEGLDLSLNNPNIGAMGAGNIRSTKPIQGYGTSVMINRGTTGDYYSYHHLRQYSIKVRNNQDVGVKQPIAIMGNTSTASGGVGKAMDDHLHLNYYVNPSQAARRRNVWLGARLKAKGCPDGGCLTGGVIRPSIVTVREKALGLASDPTPYLGFDVLIKDDAYKPYLGNTARYQFNTLYGTRLPIGVRMPGNAVAPQPGRFPAQLSSAIQKKFVNGDFALSPNEVAGLNMSSVEGSMMADSAGYGGFGGSGYTTQQVLATFLSSDDGAGFTSLPPPAMNPQFDKMTMAQMINQIGTRRYGNKQWENAMMQLSSRGMFTEYLTMAAEENFLTNQNQRLKNRLELQIAGLSSSRLFDLNKKIDTLNIMASANVVPNMINIPLEDKGDEYVTIGVGGDGGGGDNSDMGANTDFANLPSDLNGLISALLVAISSHESDAGDAGYNAFNNGTVCRPKRFSGGKTSPYNMAQMTPRQIMATWGKKGNCGGIFAAGKYQFTYNGGFDDMMKKAPQFMDLPFNKANQDAAVRMVFFERGYRKNIIKFLHTGENINMAVRDLATIWASIGTPKGMQISTKKVISNGYTSFYDEPGANSASKDATDKVWAVMRAIEKYHFDKKSGKTTAPTTPTTTTPTTTTGK